MKSTKTALALAALLAVHGCASTAAPPPPRVTEEDVVGRWTAKISLSEALQSSAEEAVGDNNAGRELLRLVPTSEFPIELKADKTFTLSFFLVLQFPGTWTLDGEAVSLKFEGSDNEFIAIATEEQGNGGLLAGQFVLIVSDDKMAMSGSQADDPDTVLTLEKVVDEEEIDDEG